MENHSVIQKYSSSPESPADINCHSKKKKNNNNNNNSTVNVLHVPWTEWLCIVTTTKQCLRCSRCFINDPMMQIGGSDSKESACNVGDPGSISWDRKIPWRREWQPTPVFLTGKIPWMEESGRLQCMGSQRVGHNWATSLSLFIFMHWRGKWQPSPVSLPGKSQGQRSLVGCHLWGCTGSDTTKRLSSSSSSQF